jgi:hypothetical protein
MNIMQRRLLFVFAFFALLAPMSVVRAQSFPTPTPPIKVPTSCAIAQDAANLNLQMALNHWRVALLKRYRDYNQQAAVYDKNYGGMDSDSPDYQAGFDDWVHVYDLLDDYDQVNTRFTAVVATLRPKPSSQTTSNVSIPLTRDQQISDALSWIHNNAASDYTGQQGLCATFVEQAIHAGLPQFPCHVGTPNGYAAELGGNLNNARFNDLTDSKAGFTIAPGGSNLKPGDVAVIQAYLGGNPAGHAAIWDGNQWVSDFQQGKGPMPWLPYPSDSYRKMNPPYVIYRWPG